MRTLRLGSSVALCAALALVLVAAGRHSSVVAAEQAYRLVPNWPQWPAGYTFEYAAGVAVDAKGVVYAFMRDADEKGGQGGKGSIRMFDRSGKYLGVWGKSDQAAFGVKTPHSLYIDREGNLWTVDRDGHQVKKFRQDGTPLLTVGTGKFGNTNTTFNGPTSLQFLENGDFVVSDGYWNSRLAFFNKDGKFLKQIGTVYGRGPGQLGQVHGVVQDSRGRFIVTDKCTGALHEDAIVPGQIDPRRVRAQPDCRAEDDWIQVFDKDGKFATFWTHIKRPLSLAIVGERIYAADDRTHVAILDAATGKELNRIQGASPSHAHQIAVDSQNSDVYIASVYPEHGGAKRGPAGPTLRRWTQTP